MTFDQGLFGGHHLGGDTGGHRCAFLPGAELATNLVGCQPGPGLAFGGLEDDLLDILEASPAVENLGSLLTAQVETPSEWLRPLLRP